MNLLSYYLFIYPKTDQQNKNFAMLTTLCRTAESSRYGDFIFKELKQSNSQTETSQFEKVH